MSSVQTTSMLHGRYHYQHLVIEKQTTSEPFIYILKAATNSFKLLKHVNFPEFLDIVKVNAEHLHRTRLPHL